VQRVLKAKNCKQASRAISQSAFVCKMLLFSHVSNRSLVDWLLVPMRMVFDFIWRIGVKLDAFEKGIFPERVGPRRMLC